MCGNISHNYDLYDSANNLIRSSYFYWSIGSEYQCGGLPRGTYRLVATAYPYNTLCDGGLPTEEVLVNIGRDPVQVNGGANLITETGDGGCQRHKIVCGYNDNFNQNACVAGPQTWTATVQGTTSNGNEFSLSAIELYGQSITFLDVPVGDYTVSCSRAIPGPTQGNTESSISIPGSGCSSTLTQINRAVTPKGIGCDSAAVIEFAFNSSNCYSTWSLVEAYGQLFGTGGIWSANKGEHIFASVPATLLTNTNSLVSTIKIKTFFEIIVYLYFASILSA
jgi:hypothetical protein